MSVEQGINRVHDLARLAQMWQTSGDVEESLVFARFQTAFDKQKPILKQVTDSLLDRFAFAGLASGLFIFG